MMKKEDFEFVAIGNWWSEYRCKLCGEHVVVHADSDTKTSPEHGVYL